METPRPDSGRIPRAGQWPRSAAGYRAPTEDRRRDIYVSRSGTRTPDSVGRKDYALKRWGVFYVDGSLGADGVGDTELVTAIGDREGYGVVFCRVYSPRDKGRTAAGSKTPHQVPVGRWMMRWPRPLPRELDATIADSTSPALRNLRVDAGHSTRAEHHARCRKEM